MKKLILFMVVILLSSSLASGYNVYIHSYKINRTDCINLLKEIPDNYMTVVKAFHFYKIYTDFEGISKDGVITLTDGCEMTEWNKTVLVHELAHASTGYRHSGIFYKKENEIWQSTLA